MTMTPLQRTKAAASLLFQHWQSGEKLSGLPDDLKPPDRAAAYQIGKILAGLSGDKVVGWKIAATSDAGQRHINVVGPLAGQLLSSRIVALGGKISLDSNIMRVAEIEFCFGFGSALPPRPQKYGQSEILEAVSSLYLSLEVPDSRFSDFTKVGALQQIADTACACWLMLGQAVATSWRDFDLSKHPVLGVLNGREVAAGTGAAALGDPRHALTWLVNEVARYSEGIKAGDVVTTGTCIIPVPIEPGDTFTADYGTFGQMSVLIT
jgi:2-keto-4-pentenoate hydratase